MSKYDYSPGGRTFYWVYYLTLVVIAFSGMGQMPILKRYYIADLPLMTWSANFYTVAWLHYLVVALLLALLAWRFTLNSRIPGKVAWAWGPRSWWGWTLLAILFCSGVIKVFKNLGVYFPPSFLVVNDLIHIGSTMAFMISGLVRLFLKGKQPAIG